MHSLQGIALYSLDGAGVGVWFYSILIYCLAVPLRFSWSTLRMSATNSKKSFVHAALSEDHIHGIVRIINVKSIPDRFCPWVRSSLTSMGTGFVIDHCKILTCAHCVEYSCTIKVLKPGFDEPFFALVEHFSRETDLAVLSVPTEFMIGVAVIPRHTASKHFNPGTAIHIVGYPGGCKQLRIESGIVRQNMLLSTEQSPHHFHTITTSARAIPGNSGGPAIDTSGNLLGLVHAVETGHISKESVAHYIPYGTVIQQVLRDIDFNGHITGVPECGFFWEPMKDGRKYGVLVQKVHSASPVFTKILIGDVVYRINGHPISSHGLVQYPSPFSGKKGTTIDQFISEMNLGMLVSLHVIRETEEGQTSFPISYFLSNCRDRYISPGSDHWWPEYFIYADYCFTALSPMHTYWERYYDRPHSKLENMQHEHPTLGRGEELVIMTSLLKEREGQPYENRSRRIMFVDLKPVKNLSGLVALVESGEEETIRFSVGLDGFKDDHVILNRREAFEHTRSTIDRVGAQSDRRIL